MDSPDPTQPDLDFSNGSLSTQCSRYLSPSAIERLKYQYCARSQLMFFFDCMYTSYVRLEARVLGRVASSGILPI